MVQSPLKAYNKDSRSSSLTLFCVFIVNIEHIYSTFDFEQVNAVCVGCRYIKYVEKNCFLFLVSIFPLMTTIK